MALNKPEKFFLETPLYETFPITLEDNTAIRNLVYFSGRIDAFCPLCSKTSTFKAISKGVSGAMVFASLDINGTKKKEVFLSLCNHIYDINFVCSRNEKHFMFFSVNVQSGSLCKIGQYPSIAELSQSELGKYREVLSPEKYKELNRGIGLVTHGVGIGAYVYLRRIFEDLIEEAHLKLATAPGWDNSIYKNARMEEKIDLLKSELPAFLVENRKLYSILSKGIHELSENECLEYFPTVKLGVELILDEKLENKKRNAKIELAKKSINKLHGDLTIKKSDG